MKLVTMVLGLMVLGGVAVGQISQAELKAELSALTGVPLASLGEVESAVVTFKTLGITLTRAKAIDLASGEVVAASWDATGTSRNYAALREAEVRVRQSTPEAKIHAKLAAEMALAQGHPITVGAWLDGDMDAIDRFADQLREGVGQNTPREVLRDMEYTLEQFVAAQVAGVATPFVEALGSLGIMPRYVSVGAPIVFFDATDAQILALAALPVVDTLYLETDKYSDTNEDSKATHRTDRVHQLGVKGRDVEVAMIENNGVDPACPWLNVLGWYRLPADPDDHIHGTSGNVASSEPTRGGSAPDVKLYSANAASYSDSNVLAAADWALAGGAAGTGGGSSPFAEILNGSYGPNSPTGVLDMMDRYYDYRVRAGIDNVVLSAGNAGLGSPVGHAGWNILLVGGINNNNDGDWTGDSMYTASCTGNPSTGCEKPNVVASGVSVNTLGDADGFGGGGAWLANGYNGTSFSAPFTTANLANTMVTGVGGGAVSTYPGAGIALMMATAWHNIEGASTLSDQDGAGAINGLAAVRAAQDLRIINDSIVPSDFTTGTYACGGSYYVRNIWLTRGDMARVCIAWLSNADATYSTDTLDADLDLRIYQGENTCSGSIVASSSSINNNFEIVEFNPTTTGWYSVRVNDFSFAGTSESLSIVWTQATRDSTRSFRLREYTSESPTMGTGPVLGRTYYMDWDAPNSPNCMDAICAPGYAGGDGYNFGGGALSPLSINLWFNLWVGDIFATTPSYLWFWNGSFGALNASGQYLGNTMTIPNYPDLEGLAISHVGLARESGTGYAGDLKEISDVHTFRPWPAGADQGLPDDGFVNVSLPFTFKFYGQTYDDVYVNSNGNLTFGSGDSDLTESAAEMLSDQPRIAALWDDLNPNNGGYVFVKQITRNDRELVVEYINVPEYSNTGANTVRVILRQDNSITIQYRDCDAVDGLVGISPGNGLSAASEIDLSGRGYYSGGTNQALFELFTVGNELDLTNTSSFWWSDVKFIPTSDAATGYRIETDIDPR